MRTRLPTEWFILTADFWLEETLLSRVKKSFRYCVWIKKFPYAFFMRSILSENLRKYEIKPFRITLGLILKASLGASILSHENEISLTCKLNSFSSEWLCTKPRFDRAASGNSEIMSYTLNMHSLAIELSCVHLIKLLQTGRRIPSLTALFRLDM